VPDDDASIGDWLSADPSDPAVVAERYDAWARTYDVDLGDWSYQAPDVVVRTLLDRHPGAASVLDVGCGTGLVGRTLRDRGYAGRLEGLDLSQASLEQAEAGGAYDALRRTDLQQRLPVDDGSVDAVVCVGVMTYLPDVEAIWRELARVTRSGGLVVLTQREDLWDARDCPGVLERLGADGTWSVEDVTGPAPYLPEGYGDGAAVGCYYLAARV
jgi:predicted TPR repeat methyltransferase